MKVHIVFQFGRLNQFPIYLYFTFSPSIYVFSGVSIRKRTERKIYRSVV